MPPSSKKTRKKLITLGTLKCLCIVLALVWTCTTIGFHSTHTGELAPSFSIDTISENRTSSIKISGNKKRSNSKATKQKKKTKETRSLPMLTTEYYNPSIISNGCLLTIVFMEPHLADTTPSNSSVWFAFESVATNTDPSSTCILLQTSACVIPGAAKNDNAPQLIYDRIYSIALEKFRAWMDRGNVRVSLLRWKKYKFPKCDYFWNPSRALMNYEYWGNSEFAALDSNTILLMQKDSVICRNFHVNNWDDIVFLGAPWPPKANLHKNPAPQDGMCNAIPRFWKMWTNQDLPTKDIICENNEIGPVGNGGFSIRSRSWMQSVIAQCPHRQFSSLKANPKCHVRTAVYEDLYFATALHGLNASLSAIPYEAALFSMETMNLNDVINYYGPEDEKNRKELVVKRLGEDIPNGGPITPIGMHKPWKFHDVEYLINYVDTCPHLEMMLPSEMYEKWSKLKQKRVESQL